MIYFTPYRWTNLIDRLGIPNADLLFDDILGKYWSPTRLYHNSQHIEDCLTHFEEYRDLSERAAEVEFSLWLHDVVYDTTRQDNESRSAVYAVCILLSNGASTAVMDRVMSNIFATCHINRPDLPDIELDSPDAQLTADIDLIVLGQNQRRYHEFEINIREEYMHVDFETYTRRRIDILQSFLDRGRIYYLDQIAARYEEQARFNLTEVIQRLKSKLLA